MERLEAAAAAGAEPVPVPAGASRDDLAAALTTLGFLARGAGGAAGRDRRGLRELCAAVRRRARPDALYLDAAQFAVLLGAATAQLIRTDLGALAAIETALGMAERAREELRRARRRVRRGARRRSALPTRTSRRCTWTGSGCWSGSTRAASYYAELVERYSRHFRPYLARSLPGLLDRSRGAALAEGRMAEDAERFVEHATADGVARAEGSYAWLADFLPRD